MIGSSIGKRLSLVGRVLIVSVIGAALAAIVAIWLSTLLVAENAKAEMESQFQAEMDGLSVAVAAALEIRHYDQVGTILAAYHKRPGIRRVNFRDVTDTLDVNNEQPIPQLAPDWFVRRCNVADKQGTRPILSNGQYFGLLTLSVASMPAVNRAWERLVNQLKTLLLTVGLTLVGVWLVLRRGLRPLGALVSGSRALGAGDLSQRIPVRGGPEFRTTIEAFNRMADDLERLLADARLREDNLRVTLNSIGDAVLTTDTAGRVQMLNPIAEQLTGWRSDEARGQPVANVFRIINEHTRETVESPVDMVLAKGITVGLANHTLLLARDGSEHPIADSGAPIRAEADGPISGVVVVFRDQSEQHRMLQALHDSEQLYATIAQAISAGVFRLDNAGRYLFFNAKFKELSGSGMMFEQIAERVQQIHPDDRERVARKWAELSDGRVEEHTADYRYLHTDGRIVWVKTVIRAVVDAAGRRDGFVGVITDISGERERMSQVVNLSRLYDTLSHINSSIVQANNEAELFENVCHIAVDRGGMSNAWIGWVHEQAPHIELVAGHGDAMDAAVEAIALAEQEIVGASSSHVEEAVITGKPLFENDFTSSSAWSTVWQQWAVQHRVTGLVTVPLFRFGRYTALMVMYTRTPNFFTPEVLKLVEEIGQDISFALENFELGRQRQAIEQQLAVNEERLRLSLAASQMGSFEFNLETNRLRLDAVTARITNLGDSDLEFSFAEYVDLTITDDALRRHFDAMINELRDLKRDHYSYERPLVLPNGRIRWLRSQGGTTNERNAAGKAMRIVGVISDTTAEREQDERERLTLSMFQSSLEAIMIADANFKWLMVNPAFTAMSGFAAADVVDHFHTFISAQRHDAAFIDDVQTTLLRDHHWRGEVWSEKKDGSLYPVLLSISAVCDRDGKITHFVGQATDISLQKEFEQRISYLAYRDSLADLPNRALLRDRVEQGLAKAQRENGAVALLFIDLDHFKNINDSLGHHVGDGLLREVAKRLLGAVRDMDTVGRLGGDEFMIMLPGADAEAAAHVAQKLLSEVVRPIQVQEHTLSVTPSIGIALFPKDGTTYDELLKTADTAMYRAKGEGRNGYRFFTPEMNQAVFQRMVLESSLRRAVEAGEFVLFYQPQFDADSGRLIGAEALIRWHQPELGFIAPGQFIPVAEECGLIEAIGSWVLREACRQMKAWQQSGLAPRRVSINVSARQFASRDLVQLFDQALAATGLSGKHLEIEITESLLANDMEYVFDVLSQLKRRGIQVAVDDFGTGYSSLSYLKRFPIDRLKIDQSFVRDLEDDADDRAIAAAVVTLGHSLGMRVIAEGVETQNQLDLLRKMGCDEVQGYHLARPLPANDFLALMRQTEA